ncbi:MAG TPA: hypothetical protein PKA00_22625 [Saprospiraceae bacterium]|nr:hypothetical protein [Saprospiraceae bacterium]
MVKYLELNNKLPGLRGRRRVYLFGQYKLKMDEGVSAMGASVFASGIVTIDRMAFAILQKVV